MVDKTLCQGCQNCVLACMVEHNKGDKNIYALDLEDISNESRGYIALDSQGKPTPIFCRHCDEPECVATCMSGAMTKNLTTGIVSYDETKCAACFMCVMSCPYGTLKADEKNKKVILKCDACEGNDVPRCVSNCPSGAIFLCEEEN